jgi:hypothetical protein
MPKKKNVEPNPTPNKVDWNGSLADFKNVTVNAKPTATVGNVKPGGTKVSTPNTGVSKGMFAGSGTPLGTSIAGSNLSAKNIVNTTLTAMAIGSAIKAATGFKVVRSVPEAVKSVQRELSSELKSQSTKGMSKTQKQGFGEASSELLPSESSRLTQYDMRNQISELMRTSKGPLKIVKKK